MEHILVHLKRNLDNLTLISNSNRFVLYDNLKIYYSSLRVCHLSVIANTIGNLKSWVWYQIKALAILFKIRPHLTPNSQILNIMKDFQNLCSTVSNVSNLRLFSLLIVANSLTPSSTLISPIQAKANHFSSEIEDSNSKIL